MLMRHCLKLVTGSSRSSVRLALLSALAFVVTALPARSDVTQIGEFINDGSPSITWTNNAPAASGSLGTVAGGAPVTFFFSNNASLPAELQGPQAAELIVSGGTTAAATTGSDGSINQPISGPLTISIIRDTAAVSGTGSHTNLLTATVSGGTTSLVGQGNSAGLNAPGPPGTVTFSSDFLNLGATPQSFSLALTAINPSLGINPSNGLLASFTSAMIGTFSAAPVPEPASLALMGIGCVVLVGARVRAARKAVV